MKWASGWVRQPDRMARAGERERGQPGGRAGEIGQEGAGESGGIEERGWRVREPERDGEKYSIDKDGAREGWMDGWMDGWSEGGREEGREGRRESGVGVLLPLSTVHQLHPAPPATTMLATLPGLLTPPPSPPLLPRLKARSVLWEQLNAVQMTGLLLQGASFIYIPMSIRAHAALHYPEELLADNGDGDNAVRPASCPVVYPFFPDTNFLAPCRGSHAVWHAAQSARDRAPGSLAVTAVVITC